MVIGRLFLIVVSGYVFKICENLLSCALIIHAFSYTSVKVITALEIYIK